MILAILFLLNAVISWFNARVCGRVWDVSAYNGGFGHFVVWCAAIMSACGFMWCLMVPTGFIVASIPMQLFASEGEVLVGMLLDEADLEAFFGLGYMVLIFPLLGSGLGLTIESWHNLMQRRHEGNADAGDYLAAGWNTFAQVHNTVDAFRNVPEVSENVSDYFKDSDDLKGLIVIALVALCFLGGVMITYGLIQHYRAEARRAYGASQILRT